MKTMVLQQAWRTVDNDRQADYNDPVENMVRQAIVQSVATGKPVTPEEFVIGMLSQKLVRAGRSEKYDTVVDLAGYAEILERVREAFRTGEIERIAAKLLPWLPIDCEKLNPHITE